MFTAAERIGGERTVTVHVLADTQNIQLTKLHDMYVYTCVYIPCCSCIAQAAAGPWTGQCTIWLHVHLHGCERATWIP